MEIKDLIQSADWKQEKHVPVIDVDKEIEIEYKMALNAFT